MIRPLTDEEESIRQDALAGLEALLGRPVHPRRIHVRSIPYQGFFSKSGILLDEGMCRVDKPQENLEWTAIHRGQDADCCREAFIKETIQHEYAHSEIVYAGIWSKIHNLVWDNWDMLRKSPVFPWKNYMQYPKRARYAMKARFLAGATSGIFEAISFWAEDSINGHQHLYEECADEYPIDANGCQFLKYFYEVLRRTSYNKGERFTVDNLLDVIRINLPYIEPVAIETYANLTG